MACALRANRAHRALWLTAALFALSACGPELDPLGCVELALRDAAGPGRFMTGVHATQPECPGIDAAESAGWTAVRSPAFARFARETEQASRERPSPETLRLSGLVRLAMGETEPAIDRLERAVSDERGADVLNDLGAAYLRRWREAGNPLDLLRALELFEAVSSRHPELAAPAFNLGLALTELHLRSLAEQAWKRFLDLESTGFWSEEARRLHERVTAGTDREWEALRARLTEPDEPGVDLVTLAVRGHPYQARTLAERELLALWLEALAAGDPARAEPWLDRIRAIGQLLATERGDRLLLRAVEAIERAMTGPRSAADVIAAHEPLRRGLELYDRQEFAAAAAELDRARHLLAWLESPFALMATLYAAICRHYSDLPGAEEALDALLGRTPEEFSSLLGQIWWMKGIVAGGQRRFEESITAYRRALALVEASSGSTRAAALRAVLAEAFDFRGETVRGWRLRLEALADIAYHGEARRHHATLLDAAQALRAEGRHELSLLFLEEVEHVFTESRLSFAGADLEFERALVLLEQDRTAAALNALDRVAGHLRAMPSGPLRSRFAARARLAEALAIATSEPERALPLLHRAHKRLREMRFLVDEIRYRLSAADALERLGSSEDSREMLRAAVEIHEQILNETSGLISKAESFRLARAALDRWVTLELRDVADSPGHERAFEIAERGRGRALLGSAAADSVRKPVTARELVAGLGSATLLEFLELGPSLYCWVATSDGMRLELLEVPPARIADRVDAFRLLLESRAPVDRVRAEAAALYDLVLRPLGLDLSDADRLVVVPDGALRKLPFAALIDAETGSYLVETITVSYAPSASLFLRAQARYREPLPGRGVLIVGATDLSAGPYAYLPPLPDARSEAETIAALETGATLLVGDRATRERVLALLPTSSVFHFAGHAVAAENAFESSALLLAPSGPDDDGRLTMADLLAGTPPELVSLAGCETLRGYEAGREGTLGLASAFVAAGVPSVLGALWSIDDTVSARIMRLVYENRRRKESTATALREATRTWLAEASPGAPGSFDWAAFQVVGI